MSFHSTVAGSNGILAAYKPLREATELVRQMIVNAAAKILNLNPNSCFTKNSMVLNTKNNQTLSFTDIHPLLLNEVIPKTAALKSPESFYLVGRDISFRENEAIVTGAQKYSIDINDKDMVFATIVRSPTVDSKVGSFDDSEVLKMPGVTQTKLMPAFAHRFLGEASWQEKYRGTKHGVAIIANSTWAAIKAKQMLDGSEHLQWTKSKYDAYDDDHLKKSLSELDDKNLRVVKSSGDTTAEIKRHSADSIHRAEYFNPYQENAQMEPLNAVAKYDGEHLTLWAGSQSPTQATDYVAAVTGIS
ncbi:MAG: molybdopterin-dependent oxidoreductase, partial [Psychrosphaera sp.]|nr:molybdopterin-dependent oxidoreductase [Psychrosphaera sp.]